MEQRMQEVELVDISEIKESKEAKPTLGTILLDQLYADPESRESAINTILEIASQVSLEKQKEFIIAYCQKCNPAIDTHALKQAYATYIKDENHLKAEQTAFTNRRAGLYTDLEKLKGWYNEAHEGDKERFKKEIKKITNQIKDLNKEYAEFKKKFYNDKQKPAVKEVLKSIHQQIRTQAVAQNLPLLAQMQGILKDLCKSPEGCIGNLFTAPLVKLKSEHKEPTPLELRHAFQDNLRIADCLYVSPKSGGANDPGQHGGNYLLCYQTADGKIHSQTIFFKQATDDGFANHRENIAEVMAGHIMNGIVGNHAASIVLAMPDKIPTEATDSNPEAAYVGSLFFKEFINFHTAAHKAVGATAGKRGRGAYGGQNINNKVLGNPKFRKGFIKLVSDSGLNVTNLSKGLMANLVVGNYQIHNENEGLARIAGEIQPVTFDFGGAFRRRFATNHLNKTKEQSGQFPKTVEPEETKSRKYNTAYLLAFPKRVRKSKEFIEGIDEVARFNQLRDCINGAVDYQIRYYGAAAFIQYFARELDTGSQRELNLNKGSLTEQVAATKTFLYHRLLARQLSLRRFSLQQKFDHPDFDQDVLRRENPIYCKYSGKLRHRLTAIHKDITAMRNFLTQLSLVADDASPLPAEITNLTEFLRYAAHPYYSLENPEDQEIITQALNEAYCAIEELPDDNIAKQAVINRMRAQFNSVAGSADIEELDALDIAPNPRDRNIGVITNLADAIDKQNRAAINRLMEDRDINQPLPRSGISPLLYAIKQGRYFAAYQLIEMGARLQDIPANTAFLFPNPNTEDHKKIRDVLEARHQLGMVRPNLTHLDEQLPPTSRATSRWKKARKYGEMFFWLVALTVMGLSVASFAAITFGLPVFIVALLPALPYLTIAFTALSAIMLRFKLMDDVDSNWNQLFLDIYPEVEHDEALLHAKTLAQQRPLPGNAEALDDGANPEDFMVVANRALLAPEDVVPPEDRAIPTDFIVLPASPVEGETLRLNPEQREKLLNMVNSALNALMVKGERYRIAQYGLSDGVENQNRQLADDVVHLKTMQFYLQRLKDHRHGDYEEVITSVINRPDFIGAYKAFKGEDAETVNRNDNSTILGRLRNTKLHPKSMMSGWLGKQWHKYFSKPAAGENRGWWLVKRVVALPFMLIATPYWLAAGVERLSAWANSPTYAEPSTSMMDGWLGKQWHKYFSKPAAGENRGWWLVKRVVASPFMLVALPYWIVAFIKQGNMRRANNPVRNAVAGNQWIRRPNSPSVEQVEQEWFEDERLRAERAEAANDDWYQQLQPAAQPTTINHRGKTFVRGVFTFFKIVIAAAALFLATVLTLAMFKSEYTDPLVRFIMDNLLGGSNSDPAWELTKGLYVPATLGIGTSVSGVVLLGISKAALKANATSYNEFKPIRDKLLHDQEVRLQHFDTESPVNFGKWNKFLLYLSASTFGLSEVLHPKLRPYRVCRRYHPDGTAVGEKPAKLSWEDWKRMVGEKPTKLSLQDWWHMVREYYAPSTTEGRRNLLRSFIKLCAVGFIIGITIALATSGGGWIVAGPIIGFYALVSAFKWWGNRKPVPQDKKLGNTTPPAEPVATEPAQGLVAEPPSPNSELTRSAPASPGPLSPSGKDDSDIGFDVDLEATPDYKHGGLKPSLETIKPTGTATLLNTSSSSSAAGATQAAMNMPDDSTKPKERKHAVGNNDQELVDMEGRLKALNMYLRLSLQFTAQATETIAQTQDRIKQFDTFSAELNQSRQDIQQHLKPLFEKTHKMRNQLQEFIEDEEPTLQTDLDISKEDGKSITSSSSNSSQADVLQVLKASNSGRPLPANSGHTSTISRSDDPKPETRKQAIINQKAPKQFFNQHKEEEAAPLISGKKMGYGT